jgi:uroporphyrin-III C-methyltransferase
LTVDPDLGRLGRIIQTTCSLEPFRNPPSRNDIHNLPHITQKLQTAGLDAATPIALVRWGTRPDQSELVGTLGTIVDQVAAAQFEAPAIAIMGRVVAMREILAAGRPLL